ncbi:BON domain-containing protein [Chitinophaga costaii]|uniref:BON domain-containing protein n=1 Tax=Chitinophaga costaii TaxID=1335309 RepID=A0A1C4FS83_9BACT|nr:BON domain-containing protein [Chitinophaga costaii]PUZ20483.1 BON domain-containing protein [Chitinophaga costaii]SCC58455.1 BON domain-containing protein [Chitinophaga costaii]
MREKTFLMTGFLALFLVACGPSDENIQEEVNTKLTSTSPGVIGKVTNGVVTLSGEVVDQSAKTDAATAVQDIKGVKKIDNQVTIALSPAPPVAIDSVKISPDDALRKSVDSSFAANGITGITTSISNGVLTLTGQTAKTSLRKIMQIVHASHPKKVNNQLTLK